MYFVVVLLLTKNAGDVIPKMFLEQAASLNPDGKINFLRTAYTASPDNILYALDNNIPTENDYVDFLMYWVDIERTTIDADIGKSMLNYHRHNNSDRIYDLILSNAVYRAAITDKMIEHLGSVYFSFFIGNNYINNRRDIYRSNIETVINLFYAGSPLNVYESLVTAYTLIVTEYDVPLEQIMVYYGIFTEMLAEFNSTELQPFFRPVVANLVLLERFLNDTGYTVSAEDTQNLPEDAERTKLFGF